MGSLIARAPTCSPLMSYKKRDSRYIVKEIDSKRKNEISWQRTLLTTKREDNNGTHNISVKQESKGW